MPQIQEALESLVGAGHFSCLDLKSRFWQIRMDETLKQYTTFTVGNLGFFECDRMPFGLCNAPATFQWLMQNCMGELNFIYCLREYYLKLKPSECSVFREELRNYLAHKVSKVWYSTTLENTI